MSECSLHEQCLSSSVKSKKNIFKKIEVFPGNLILTQTHGVLNFSNNTLHLLIMKNISKRKHSSLYNIQ